MPVLVSLEKLVSIRGTGPLWPVAFVSLATKLNENPNDKVAWGVAADWLCEPEVGEQELGEAFRWIHKRDAVQIEPDRYTRGLFDFRDSGMPRAVMDNIRENRSAGAPDRSTLPGLAAVLAASIRRLKEEML